MERLLVSKMPQLLPLSEIDGIFGTREDPSHISFTFTCDAETATSIDDRQRETLNTLVEIV